MLEKSSKDWAEEYQVTVYDPDGWDRTNFDESWSELISEEEFVRRCSVSTVICKSKEDWDRVFGKKVMTKQQYKEAVRKLTQEWLDSELARCKEKGLSPEGVDIYVETVPETTLAGEIVRYHVTQVDVKIHVSV